MRGSLLQRPPEVGLGDFNGIQFRGSLMSSLMAAETEDWGVPCSEDWASSGCCVHARVGELGGCPGGWMGLPGCPTLMFEGAWADCWVLCTLRMARGCQLPGLPAACIARASGSPLWPRVFLVYPSLESDEDSPVFKSRSKKRKASDDAPYSPTGSTAGAGAAHLLPSWAWALPPGALLVGLQWGSPWRAPFSPGPPSPVSLAGIPDPVGLLPDLP